MFCFLRSLSLLTVVKYIFLYITYNKIVNLRPSLQQNVGLRKLRHYLQILYKETFDTYLFPKISKGRPLIKGVGSVRTKHAFISTVRKYW